ncbi:unnamed protein product, partial [Ascophyllum nodosum]
MSEVNASNDSHGAWNKVVEWLSKHKSPEYFIEEQCCGDGALSCNTPERALPSTPRVRVGAHASASRAVSKLYAGHEWRRRNFMPRESILEHTSTLSWPIKPSSALGISSEPFFKIPLRLINADSW